MAVIYLATNRINGKRYVGFTRNLERRKVLHKSAANCGSPYVFHRAIRKYGFDVFEFFVLCEDSDEQHLLHVVEPQMIAGLRPEYNTTKGGEGVLVDKLTEEHKQKLSENHADMRGEKNPFYGKIHTKESRQKMSESLKGRVGPNIGKKFSEEWKHKLSKAAKQRYQQSEHPRLGTTHTEESKAKMSQKRRNRTTKHFSVVFPDGRTQLITNLSDFCKQSGLDPTRMYSVAAGKFKQHKGFTCIISGESLC